MKVNTVEQFKVLQFLKEQFELELLDRYSIKITDSTGDKMIFKWDDKKVIWKE